jgi:hypothetical protein
MNMADDEAPTPHQIADSPELAVLDALSRTLLVTRHALFAAHPVLTSADAPDEDDAAAWLAVQIHGIAVLLGDTIDAYRDVVTRPRRSM